MTKQEVPLCGIMHIKRIVEYRYLYSTNIRWCAFVLQETNWVGTDFFFVFPYRSCAFVFHFVGILCCQHSWFRFLVFLDRGSAFLFFINCYKRFSYYTIGC